MKKATVDVRPGDAVALAAERIACGFGDSVDVGGPPQAISLRILDEHWMHSDDAVAVAVGAVRP